MARIILSLRGRELDKFLLGKGKITIGRGAECDVTIDNAAVSRSHASIEYKDGEYYVSDLGSSNGTFLNGNQLEAPSIIKPGDNIGVAKFNLSFQDAPQAEVQKLVGDIDNLEATMVVDAEKMAQSMAAIGGDAAPQASGPRKLVVLKGNSNVKELVIERDVITLGKAESCDLIIPGFTVGKVEATLSHKQSNYYITPLSGNIKINTVKTSKETMLNVGDTFAIGKTLIAFT